jgi:translocator protein
LKNIFKLILCITIPLAVGGLSAFFTVSSVKTWFVTLNKPSFNPPNWLFQPVWTALYFMMGIALYLVWTNRKTFEEKKTAYLFYWAQLIANFLWSILFFYFKRPDFALIDIVLMLLLIAATIFYFRKINTAAAWLLVPYLCWVSFATALNFEIWRLN